jgi:hypothetical protein
MAAGEQSGDLAEIWRKDGIEHGAKTAGEASDLENLWPKAIPLNYQIGHFFLPFFLPRFLWGLEIERGGWSRRLASAFLEGAQ